MCLQNLSRFNITNVSFQQPMSPQGPSLYIPISLVSHTTNDNSHPIRVSRESPSCLTLSPFVSLIHHIRPTLQLVRHYPPICVFSSSYFRSTVVSVLSYPGASATDRVISVIALPDDTGSIAPRFGPKHPPQQMVSSTLRARSSNASPLPGVWADARPARSTAAT
jgi:hypothetical protein